MELLIMQTDKNKAAAELEDVLNNAYLLIFKSHELAKEYGAGAEELANEIDEILKKVDDLCWEFPLTTYTRGSRHPKGKINATTGQADVSGNDLRRGI
jgi:hypothetical protein